uniref:protein inturned isoform X2 n=1 Tax=Myxine glutinosa TaxID=7769 RepID=UPI00358FAEC9
MDAYGDGSNGSECTPADVQTSRWSDSDTSESEEATGFSYPRCEWMERVQKNGELFYLELSENEELFLEEESLRCEGHPPRNQHSTKKQSSCQIPVAGLSGKFTTGLDSPHLTPEKSPSHQERIFDVWVYVDPLKLQTGGRSLLESLLGILHQLAWPGRSGRDPLHGSETIKVHGLTDGGAAMVSGLIFIGDSLVAVDDVEVSARSVESVLSPVIRPTKLKLTLARRSVKQRPFPSGLRWVSTGGDIPHLLSRLQQEPLVVLYLSLKLDSSTSDEEDGILYHFPRDGLAERLQSIRGIFLTLADVLTRVMGACAISSSLILEGHLTHVGYWQEGQELLLLALPAHRVSLTRLRVIMKNVVNLLCFMYQSLHRAFTQDVGELDNFFFLLFQHILHQNSLATDYVPLGVQEETQGILEDLSAASLLPLPPSIKLDVDTALSKLEAADFGNLSEEYYGLRRFYSILGSVVFYKGYLLSNHLPQERLRNILLFCRHRNLLGVGMPRLSRLIAWREVFLTAVPAMHTGYTEPEGARYFLLVLGLGHFLLSVLLETGGCTVPLQGQPGPDPGYVEQAYKVLLELEKHCIPVQLDSCLHPQKASSTRPDLSNINKSDEQPGFRRHARTQSLPPTIPLGLAQNMKSSRSRHLSPSPQRNLSVSFTPLKPPISPTWGGYRLWKDGTGAKQSQENVSRSMSGHSSCLYFLSLEISSAVYITPRGGLLGDSGNSLNPKVLMKFLHCCNDIHSLFESRRTPKCSPPVADDPVHEHGVVFSLAPEKGQDLHRQPLLRRYWVVGRWFEKPRREVFVCMHDPVSQTAVELAFQLGFGWLRS